MYYSSITVQPDGMPLTPVGQDTSFALTKVPLSSPVGTPSSHS